VGRSLAIGLLGKRVAWAFLVLIAAGLSHNARAQTADETVANQWFTGSLEAPSPALSKGGSFAMEPYAIYTSNTGAYNDGGGHYSVAHNLNQAQSVTMLEYGITNRLSIQVLPSFAYSWNNQTTSSGVGAGDLPLDLKYRLIDENDKTGSPSVTFDLGMNFPIGAYDRLSTQLDGLGTGAYTVKEGLLLQSLFDTWGDHPMRLRLFGAAYEPLTDVSVHDLSVYGTAPGFLGQAAPGFAADVGLGVEYGLNQRWVVAIDLVENYADGFRLNGTDAAGDSVHAHTASSTNLGLAPAIEYNWSNSVGLIAGVEFSVAGRNTASYIAPQLALSISF
jgi:hypothetical protein